MKTQRKIINFGEINRSSQPVRQQPSRQVKKPPSRQVKKLPKKTAATTIEIKGKKIRVPPLDLDI